LSEHFRRELGQLQDWERTQLLASLQRIAAIMSAPEVAAEPYLLHEPAAGSENSGAG
jgi:hypothetical protein